MQTKTDAFYEEYTSQDAIQKYSVATAGFGISYLLDHDYKRVYYSAIQSLPKEIKEKGIRMLEFGCGAGMNIIKLFSVLNRDGIRVETAIGTDFSPVLIDQARSEAKYLLGEDGKVQFCVANNDTLKQDLSSGLEQDAASAFDFILGVNTIRYSHRSGNQSHCCRDILDMLVPGGVCVNIDMNDRFPLFRSELRERLRRGKRDDIESYLPSLKQYTEPFAEAGFEILRSESFCWIPHSSGRTMCFFLKAASPLLNLLAKSRAMRSLVVARKPT